VFFPQVHLVANVHTQNNLTWLGLFFFLFSPFQLEAMKYLHIDYSHNKRGQNHELPVGW